MQRIDRHGRDVTKFPELHGLEDMVRITIDIPYRLYERLANLTSQTDLPSIEAMASLQVARGMRETEAIRQREAED